MSKKVFVMGAAILDAAARPVEREVFDTGSCAAEDISMSTGGDALNEATVLARLGNPPYLCTVLGRDLAGEFVKAHCQSCGISMEYVTWQEGLSTSVNIVLVQKNGERNFLTDPHSSLRALELGHVPEIFPKDAQIISLASMFVSPRLGISHMETLFRRAKDQGKIVCADMTKRKNGETLEDLAGLLPFIDYLLPNDQEAALLTGEQDVEKISGLFLQYGVKNVVIKSGNKGCYVRNAQIQEWIPAVPGIVAVDTTGAGDCFVGGFLHALCQDMDLVTCAKWGNACGSLAVECTGATQGIRDGKQVQERLEYSL